MRDVLASAPVSWVAHWMSTSPRAASLVATCIVCLTYFALMLATRWFIIARADRMLIREHLDKLRAELATSSNKGHSPEILQGVRELIAAAKAKERRRGLGYVLFWGGSYEDSAWYNIHDAKLLLTCLWTWPQIHVRLVSVSAELHAAEGGRHCEALALAKEVDARLQRWSGKEPTGEEVEQARSFLQRSLRVVYSMEGERDQRARTWNNRITWMAICSLGFICLLTAAFGNAELFLLGATGGFLSRLGQIRTAKGIATGYGVYWTTLFISPLIGALAGWTGLLASSVLAGNDVFGKALSWPQEGTPLSPTSMAAALLLGFSERLFNSVINRQVSDTSKPLAEAPAPASSPPESMSSQPAGRLPPARHRKAGASG